MQENELLVTVATNPDNPCNTDSSDIKLVRCPYGMDVVLYKKSKDSL